MAPRYLEAQFANGVPGNAGRITVELWRFNVVAMLIGLAASEGRCFEFPGIKHHTTREHTKRDVGAVQPMMRDWRFWNVHATCPMHEGRGAKGRFTRQTRIDVDTGGLVERVTIGGGKLHEEVMRVLAVYQMCASIRGLAGRK